VQDGVPTRAPELHLAGEVDDAAFDEVQDGVPTRAPELHLGDGSHTINLFLDILDVDKQRANDLGGDDLVKERLLVGRRSVCPRDLALERLALVPLELPQAIELDKKRLGRLLVIGLCWPPSKLPLSKFRYHEINQVNKSCNYWCVH
jgi:hypothetical protein